MSSSSRAELPLTGADCFLRAFDDEVRRRCGASHASQLVLRLGVGFDAGRLAALMERVAAAHPILYAPIRRRGFRPPAYRMDRARPEAAPRVRVHPLQQGRALPELFFERMNERFRATRGELMAVDVVPREEGRTDMALTWLHMLFDGAGSEAFVEWLDSVDRGERSVTELPPDDLEAAAPGMPEGLGARERGRRATAWQRWMATMADPAPRSLGGPLRTVPQALRYDLTTFDPAETEAIVARAKQSAGFLTPMLFYLATAIRAHDAVFRARGLAPGAYVVPLPVNLRPKGSEHALFRTRVSLLWFRVLPEIVGDFEALVAELKAQRVAAIKAKQIENGAIAMDYARYAPMRVYAHMARRAARGELCSFFFAFTGEFAGGIDHFLGAPIENAFHAPPVPVSPGSSAAMSLRGGRLNVTHVQQAGLLSREERQLFQETLRADLLGIA
ncbi:MAG: hypothetical protein CL910_15455 [Deltaproteobacteria bacterium]|nr:hypothetical protein [Deltaproteobacteria bacterium]